MLVDGVRRWWYIKNEAYRIRARLVFRGLDICPGPSKNATLHRVNIVATNF